MNTSYFSYYGFPIETLTVDGDFIEFSRWGSGIRLVAVNHKNPDTLTNGEFSYFVELVQDLA